MEDFVAAYTKQIKDDMEREIRKFLVQNGYLEEHEEITPERVNQLACELDEAGKELRCEMFCRIDGTSAGVIYVPFVDYKDMPITREEIYNGFNLAEKGYSL